MAKESPSEYIQRIMREEGLTMRQVSERAREQGLKISDVAIKHIIEGETRNPGVETLKALAAGLGKPNLEIAAAFGLGD